MLAEPVVGSIVGTRVDLAEVFGLHRRGRPQVIDEIDEKDKLDEVNEEFYAVLSGQVTARRVFAL